MDIANFFVKKHCVLRTFSDRYSDQFSILNQKKNVSIFLLLTELKKTRLKTKWQFFDCFIPFAVYKFFDRNKVSEKIDQYIFVISSMSSIQRYIKSSKTKLHSKSELRARFLSVLYPGCWNSQWFSYVYHTRLLMILSSFWQWIW